MGITGIVKPCFVIQCGHCGHPKCFFLENPDGSKPVDFMWESFPTKGRMLMMKETIFLACWGCREGLDVMVQTYGKTWSEQSVGNDG
jgi:hypothetical protein